MSKLGKLIAVVSLLTIVFVQSSEAFAQASQNSVSTSPLSLALNLRQGQATSQTIQYNNNSTKAIKIEMGLKKYTSVNGVSSISNFPINDPELKLVKFSKVSFIAEPKSTNNIVVTLQMPKVAKPSYKFAIVFNNITTNSQKLGVATNNAMLVTMNLKSKYDSDYAVTGTVSGILTLSTSSSVDTFSSNFSPSAVTTTTGVTTTVSTNNPNGYTVFVKDTNGGLYSLRAKHLIASVPTGANYNLTTKVDTEAYAIGAVGPGVLANYNYGPGTFGGGLSSSTYQPIVTYNAAANGINFVTHELVDISYTTPPASDYTDIISEIVLAN